jgi:hypothetical protein
VSPFDKGTVYIAVNKYKFNDFSPFIYKSTDYGKTWTKLTEGIPYGAFVRVVREDAEIKGLLYAGTETGFYISYDAGAHWKQLQLNLPVVPITDLKLHQHKLLASTQGRAFWVLDDLAPLRKAASTITASYSLLPVNDVYRIAGASPLDRQFSEEEEPNKIHTTMENPATGAVVYYHIQNKDSVKSLSLEFVDASNHVIRTYYKDKPAITTSNNSLDADPKVEVRTGLNRFVWDLRYPNLPTIDNVYIEGSNAGRKVIPGNYFVRLKINDTVLTSRIKVLADPRLSYTISDYELQDKYSRLASEDVEAIHVSVVQMRKVQDQLNNFLQRAESVKGLDSLISKAKSILSVIKTWEESLIQSKSQSNDDVINFVNKLSANIIFVKGEIDGSGASAYVTEGQMKRYNELHEEWEKYQTQKNNLLAKDIKDFNEACRKANWNLVGYEN